MRFLFVMWLLKDALSIWACSQCAHPLRPYSASYRTRLRINQTNEWLAQCNVRRVLCPLLQRSERAEPAFLEGREAKYRDYGTGQPTELTQA
jgi:hypothetical protein